MTGKQESWPMSAESGVFVDGAHRSLYVQGLLFLTLFMILPIGVLWTLAVSLTLPDFTLGHFLFVFVPALFVLGLVYRMFKYYRVHFVIRAEVSEKEVVVLLFLRKVTVPWEDIISFKVPEGIFGASREAAVKTRTGEFFSPLTMLNEDARYPKLKFSTSGWIWVDKNGASEESKLENCPLYIAIMQHMRERARI